MKKLLLTQQFVSRSQQVPMQFQRSLRNLLGRGALLKQVPWKHYKSHRFQTENPKGAVPSMMK
jgi:hypothetical protein